MKQDKWINDTEYVNFTYLQHLGTDYRLNWFDSFAALGEKKDECKSNLWQETHFTKFH